MWDWYTAWRNMTGASKPTKRRQRTAVGDALETLEQRALLTVSLQPGDVIFERNYRPAGSDDADSGFLIYRPSTGSYTPLVVPRLNVPGEINYGIYIFDFHLVWETAGVETPQPHIYFAATIVPTQPVFGSVATTGIFDFDLNAETLTSLQTIPERDGSGNEYSFYDMAIHADGTGLVATKYTEPNLFADIDVAFEVGGLPGGPIYYEQEIDVLNGSFAYIPGMPTSDLEYDAEGTLYAAFKENDGNYFHEDDEVVGNEIHDGAIYRLNPEDPSKRDLVFSDPGSEIVFEFAVDGSIIAAISDGQWRYYKKDSTQERLLKIDPDTGTSQLLWKAKKCYELSDVKVLADGRILVVVTDVRKDGATALLEFTPGSKKKLKPRVIYAESDTVDYPYGVITSGRIDVVRAIPGAAATVPASDAEPTGQEVTHTTKAARKAEKHEARAQRRAQKGRMS